MTDLTMTCRLCGSKEIKRLEFTFQNRAFDLCGNCNLIMVNKLSFPSPILEKKRYLKHRNQITDLGYIRFLEQALNPAVSFLEKDMSGLDYGCGPTAVLAEVLRLRGWNCDTYDPFFYPVLKDQVYDYIFATECFEHFFYPANDMLKIMNLLKPEGFLIVMTDTWASVEQFYNWYYIRDLTHVSFFNENTMHYLCRTYNLNLCYSDNLRVFIFKKVA